MTGTILVTGASGFIGRSLVQALAREGFAVRAAARDPRSVPAREGITPVAMPDLATPGDWGALLDGARHVVHLAGIAHSPGLIADDLYRRINATAVGELAENAARAKVERLVSVSSVRAQAGLSADHALTEKDEPQPTDAYGRSKLEAERLVAASGAPFTILRPAVVYGPGVKGNIASLATLARTPMPLPFANLDNRRSLLALDNFIAAVVFVLGSERAANETFLVADREPISVANLVGAMREGLGRPPLLVGVPQGAVKRLMRSFGKEAEWERISGNFVIDPSKLMGIGWRPSVSTHDGIVAMMRAESVTTSS
ncbi:NAD-dependent epimerase/dehydratase family protein [Methyloceanibacter sp.]|uniref:NAD-dependent epimerase/dehydratase family protein n=1 Tax=Methyloceanibacter sp. TaxID=1965321 RepID=UPI002D5FFD0E|nr:NAD-dependent epimerase/dehydratase family protein [Methyloceanibacter sp.]HZP09032.1 NAD-dependent epimerase/dehydratase family protein [Methyloceanibacter sp.]